MGKFGTTNTLSVLLPITLNSSAILFDTVIVGVDETNSFSQFVHKRMAYLFINILLTYIGKSTAMYLAISPFFFVLLKINFSAISVNNLEDLEQYSWSSYTKGTPNSDIIIAEKILCACTMSGFTSLMTFSTCFLTECQ